MKMENLDLFHDLMEQAEVKAQCDAEDKRNDAIADGIIDTLKRSLDAVRGIPGTIEARKDGDGIAVKLNCSAADTPLIVGSIIRSAFDSYATKMPDKDAGFILALTSAAHFMGIIKECISKAEGEQS